VLHESYDEGDEATFVTREAANLRKSGFAWSDIAVMYRTNAQYRALEEAFMQDAIPYRLIGGTRFYARKEIKDVLAFLRLAQNPDDNISFMRVVGVPPRGIGAQTLAKVAAQAGGVDDSYFRAAETLVVQQTLRKRTSQALHAFTEMVSGWHAAHEVLSVSQILDRILSDTGYEGYLRDGTDEGESRWENVMALRTVTTEGEVLSLTDFLTEVALVADVDDLADTVEAVTLLTLHSAKGLEYPVVFITGLEDGMLPHSRSIEDSPRAVAEERRLLYVGMTRAEEKLYLSYAFQRHWYGRSEPSRPSRFLEDLPAEVLGAVQKPAQPSWQSSGWEVQGWGSVVQQQRSRKPSAVQQRFYPGQKVQHRSFGTGTVQDSHIEHGDELVTVLFFDSGVGVKQFLASLAPLEPLSEH